MEVDITVKIEENVERARVLRKMSNGKTVVVLTGLLFKSLESWNVTPFKMVTEQTGLINILFLLHFNFIFHYTFYRLTKY